MSSRRVREDHYRRVFAAGLGLSLGVHAVVLGLTSFEAPGSAADVEQPRPQEEVRLQTPALELVELASIPAPIPARPATEPVGRVERVAVEATPAAASPAARIEAQLALTMRPDFTTQRSLSAWALQPVQAPGDREGGRDAEHADSGEDEESGGRSWWEGLGISFGGGGGHCPVPARGPPVVNR